MGSSPTSRTFLYICGMATVKKTAQYYKDNPEAANKKAEYDTAFNATPKQKRIRALRNKLRRFFKRRGEVKKGDGKDVHHTGGTSVGTATVMPASKNRAIK